MFGHIRQLVAIWVCVGGLLLCAPGHTYGQGSDERRPNATVIDSLEGELNKSLNTSQRLAVLDKLASLNDPNQTEKAIRYRMMAYALCAQEGDSACMALEAFHSIYHLINIARFDTVRQFLDLTERYYQPRDSMMYARVLQAHGFYYGRIPQFHQALLSYLKAQRIFLALGDTAKATDIKFYLGLIFYQLNNFSKALYYFDSVVQDCESYPLCPAYRDALFYISRIHIEEQHFEQALPVLRKYIGLNQDTTDYRPKAFREWALAMLEIAQGHDEQGRFHIHNAIELFESLQLFGDVSNLYLLRGDLDLKKSIAGAIQMYTLALASAEKMNGHTVIMKSHRRLADAYTALNQFKPALKHLRAYQTLYEQRNVGLEAQLAEQELAYTTKQYDQTIALLNAQQEVTQLKAKRQHVQRNSLLGLAGFFLILASLLYYLLYQNRKSGQLLRKKNIIIDQSLRDKELLLREIHHRVKNSLQIVSSMLHLQSRHVRDPAILSALRDSRNRVNSMALIHQSLYKEEHLKGIQARDYIESLKENLVTSFRVDPDRVLITTDIQALLLDVDTAIPIGQIINELVTNAIKYAFTDDQKGTVQIRLKETEQVLILAVTDDGAGLPADFQTRSQASYGYHLIHSLARKLKAEVEIHNVVGCSVTVRIKQYKILQG